MTASDTPPPLTDEELQAFCDAAPPRIDTPLWTHLDWSLWGTGLGDTLREPMASAMVAAIPADVRGHAEMVMAEFLKFRGVESPAQTNAELRAELKMARAQTCSRRDVLVAEEMMRQAQEEAHRLRAELATVSDEAGVQCREAAARTVRAEKERDALAAKLATVLELHRPVNFRGIQVCNACTPLDVLMQTMSGRGRRGVEHPCATARAALGETGGTGE